MAKLKCFDCGIIIEDSGAVEDDDYVCGKCVEKRLEEDLWLEQYGSEGKLLPIMKRTG